MSNDNAAERDALLRRAEAIEDPHARARRLAAGEWVPPETPEEAKEFLEGVERAEYEDRELRWLEADAARDERSAETRARQHSLRAREIASIRTKLRLSAEGHAHRAANLVIGREKQHLPHNEFRSFLEATNSAVRDAKIDATLAEMERREKDRAQELRAKVTREAAPYAPDSRHSWFVDLAVVNDQQLPGLTGAAFGDMSRTAIEERLRKHAIDVRRDYLKRGERARQIERIVRERCRHEDEEIHQRKVREEIRALTTGGGATSSASGGAAAFVAPAFILDAWAPYRGIARSFADQCGTAPMPQYGMEVYIPAFTAGAAVSQQTEASGLSDTTPTATLLGAQVQTVAGEIDISQQLHDRGFTGGGSFDAALAKQLGQQLNEKVELYVLNTVITNGASVSGSATWSIANLYQDIAKGREQLTDTAGVRLRPTHFFSTSDFYSYVTRQLDSENRPIVVPQFAPGFPVATGADDGPQSDQPRPKWSRFTGTMLPGGVVWMTADAIPATSGNTQFILSAPDQSVVLAEGEPVLGVFPQTYAGSLNVVVTLREYVVAILRSTSGSAVITGAAYPTTLV